MSVKVYVETHGCQMNVADTERAIKKLTEQGYSSVEEPAQADVVLLNTCSVRERAEAKVFNRIGEIKKSSRGRPMKFGVMGCVAQLEGTNLFNRSRSIDFVVGTQATDRLPTIIDSVIGGENQVYDLAARKEGENWDLTPSDHSSRTTAFVPIIEGCNKFCSYCIVPFSRGREVSRTAAEIVAQVNALRESGYKEVQLIGQNVNSYRPKVDVGLEASRGATPFSRLLRSVAATEIERIKFTTSFPRDFHSDIVSAMDEYSNLCNWVHLPVQSGSDAVLRNMRRGYKVSDYLSKVEAVTRSKRDIALTTDIIVGFPGETAEDFDATLDLVRRVRFHALYIFKYSRRPGTRAANLIDDVPPEEKTRRFAMLESLQAEIQEEIYDSYVGRMLSVLVRGRSARENADVGGHSGCNKVVNFKSDAYGEGEIVEVVITEAKRNSLYGRAVSMDQRIR